MNFNEAAVLMNTCPVYGSGSNAVKELLYTYDPAALYKLRAFCMYDKVIAFDENSGSVRAEY